MVWEETIVTSRDSALDIMVTRKSVFWKYTKCFLVKNVCGVFIDCVVVLFDVLVLYIGVMSGGRSIDKERKSPRESGEDSEDESEILEESPCGRWLKRREEVSTRYHSLVPLLGYFWAVETKTVVSWFTRLVHVKQIRRSYKMFLLGLQGLLSYSINMMTTAGSSPISTDSIKTFYWWHNHDNQWINYLLSYLLDSCCN